MEHESVLERRLNGDEDPTDLPLALLKHITNDFSEERKIGQGGFAAVYKGVLRNGAIVAVKRIDVNVYTLDGKSFRREFNSLMFTNHENVVRFLGFCSNTHQTSIKEAGTGKNYLVNENERMLCLEYISNGSLDKHITDELRGLPWETRYKIITGICNGLSYLHTEKIIHMDLKPGNILLDDHMVPKITDFGLSRPDENSCTKGQCFGTPGYMAPEYEKDGKTSFKCDIYSLGVIIIELITGCKGVPDKHNVLRRWRHRWSKSPTLVQIQQVTRCIEIAVCCRKQDPKSRPSIVDIVSSLKKSESTNGLTAEISSSCFDEDDMLRIMPLELRLPYELKDEITCFTVELTNDTRSCIAFHIQLPSRQQYSAQPYKGIVQPESICGVKITVFPQAQDVQDHDHVHNLIVQSMKLSGDLRYKVITESMFHQEADKVVDEVSLMVVYEPASRKSKHGRQIPKRASLSRHYPTNIKYLGKESDRAVDVTRGAMGSLLDKLGKLVTEDYNLEDTMKRDIEYFSEEMKKIHLDIPQLENLDGVRDWINEVRELSYISEDMLDGFLVHVEHESNWSPFEEVPHDGVKLLENCNNQNGDVMRDIKRKVQDLADRRKKFNYDVKNVTSSATAKSTIDFQISAIYEDKEQLIGIKAPRDELIRLIDEDGDVSKEMLRIFSIVGMGGLGKTALAKAVYDKLQAQYHPCAFVRMGQNVDVKIVLKNILAQCRNDAANLEDLDARELIDQLQKLLKSKRYFIVIDDIWDSEAWDTETWGTIRSAFPRNNCGSRVITTTRASHVAMACCYDERRYMHVMKPLSDEYSRRLFFSRVFGSEEACPDALKDDSIDILKRCGGMPLAINTIASLLAGGQPRSTWDNVRKNWGAMLKGNDLEKMKQILEMNYILLPDQVKPCLLHVGMYPDDQEIDKNDLVRQWVAEDFVHGSTDDGLDAEDVAGLFFNLLIGTFMIQPGKIDNYNSKLLTCTVHPIMLDLIRAKAAKENFIHVANGSKDGKWKIHRVSVHYNDKEDDRLLDAIKEGSLSHVRSVLLFQSSLLPYFMEFNYVRVLHLEHKVSSMVLDLTDISRLFLLRFLKVTSDDLEYELKLPNQIGELHQLETIDLHNASLKNYPSDIVSLPWLMHLSLTGKEASVVLPDGIERLKLLRTLVGVDVVESSVENIMGISRLTNLRKLHICSKGIVQPTNKHVSALHSSITMLSSSLRIFTFECKWTIKLDVPGRVSMALFPRGSHIGELDLGKCEFERCPEWIGQLYHLYKLTIWVREVADGINIVGGLPSLVYFHLSIARGSGQKEERVFIPSRGAFKSLKHLIFYCQTASLTFEVGAMPKLENLTIMFRYHMTHQFLPVGIEHLPTGTLKEIWLLVAPNDKSQAIGKHRTSVRRLLKGAFKSHHPTAKIVFYFSGGFPVPIDEEDSDNEATRQGNLTLTSVMQNMGKDKGEVINHITTFFETPAPKEWDPATSREQWISLAAALRLEGYTKKYKEKHGAKSDPRQEPFYDEVAMLARGDMENGQLWVGDGSVDTTNIPTLSQIFASRTSLQPAIEHPRPDVHMLNQLQTRLHEETRRREEVELNLQRMQELMAQQQAAYEARFAAYDTHFARLDAMSDATLQDPLPPLGFNFLHPSVGSKNVPVGGSAHGQASQVTTTGHGASSSSQQ